uniref:Skp1-related protein n=1 Tax=Globodera rostochiensis TaxID=31243 RepID=A0A914I1S6_GLORO
MTEEGSSSSTSATDSPADKVLQFSEELLQKEVPCDCKDGERVQVRVSLLLQSKTFADMWKDLNLSSKDLPDSLVFPMSTISAPIFKKVGNWMENHVGKPQPVIEEDPNTHERKWFTLTDYEKEFFNVDVEELAELLVAANFLNLQSLYIYGCQSMAALMKEKTPEEIRNLFGIPDDLTEEEKAEIRRKNVWCNY